MLEKSTIELIEGVSAVRRFMDEKPKEVQGISRPFVEHLLSLAEQLSVDILERANAEIVKAEEEDSPRYILSSLIQQEVDAYFRTKGL